MQECDYIVSKTDGFISALDRAGQELAAFEQTLNQMDGDVVKRIRKFSADCAALSAKFKKSGKMTAVDEALNVALSEIASSVASWEKAFEQNRSGKKFMIEHQKYLAAMVFGAVKAGKSTLGNFLAGRELLKAPFDNRYKHLPVTEFSSQEQARKTGGMTEKDSEGRRWFCEGVTDTTGDIQYFTLSGLRWFDSPGTGSLGTAEDFRKMDEMVKEYLNYVDLCIFLINSSEPGLTEDMKYMKFLNASNQEALVVITKSDFFDEDVDDDGNIVSETRPKDDETRKMQEDDMCQRLRKQYPDLDSSKYRAISISTSLAKEAVKNGDAKKFRESHLDLLMDRISEKAAENIIELKKKRPREAFGKFISDVRNGSDDFGGIAAVLASLDQVQENITHFQGEIENKTRLLTQNILSVVKSAMEKKLVDLSSEVSRRHSVSADDISAMLKEITFGEMKKVIGRAIGEIIGQNLNVMQDIPLSAGAAGIKSSGITQRYIEVEHEYVEAVEESRDPEGIIEHVCSWFGKEYTEVTYKHLTKVEKIASGTNIEKVLDEVQKQVTSYVQDTVRDNLNNIANTFFKTQERFITEIRARAGELSSGLEDIRRQVAGE
ncbi:hypothetical protein [Succinimonas sp.]|uniref:hypothetical protein n=1 Tax=Succinimonas sp. TaxID=1936151 RepID=UPI00386B2111